MNNDIKISNDLGIFYNSEGSYHALDDEPGRDVDPGHEADEPLEDPGLWTHHALRAPDLPSQLKFLRSFFTDKNSKAETINGRVRV